MSSGCETLTRSLCRRRTNRDDHRDSPSAEGAGTRLTCVSESLAADSAGSHEGPSECRAVDRASGELNLTTDHAAEESTASRRPRNRVSPRVSSCVSLCLLLPRYSHQLRRSTAWKAPSPGFPGSCICWVSSEMAGAAATTSASNFVVSSGSILHVE